MSKLDAFCDQLGIRLDFRPIPAPPGEAGWLAGSAHYSVTLRRTVAGRRRRLTCEFHQGPAVCRDPSPADVLSCLLLDARSGALNFEEFCSDYSYDPDSRKAERIHRVCQQLRPKVRRFCGSQLAALERAAAEH